MNPNEVTLKQGTNYYNNQTGKLEGTVQYDAKTGQKLAAGQTTAQAMPSNVITPDSLKTVTPLTIPTPTTDVTPINNLLGNVNNVVATATANSAKPLTGSNSDVLSLINKLGTRSTVEADLNKQYNIDEQAKRVKDLEAGILTADQAYKKNIDSIYAQGGTTREQAQPAVTEANRLYASQNADRAIAYHLANQDYTSALDTVNKKVEAEFSGYKDQLTALNTFITQNKQLSDADRMALQDKYQKGMIDYQAKKELASYQAKYNIDKYGINDPNYVPQAPGSYTVTTNDNGGLYQIAQQNGIDFETLKLMNPGIGDVIKPGQILKLPNVDVNNAMGQIANFFKTNPKISDINMQNAGAVVSSIQDFGEANKSGNIKGYGFLGGGFLPESLLSQKGIDTRLNISALDGKVQQWLSGAALSKGQEKLVKKMIPGRNDTDTTVQNKLNALAQYMMADIKGRAALKGTSFNFTPVDFWAKPSVTPQTPQLGSAIIQAQATGYEPAEIIDYIITTYPEKQAQIVQARQSGYSDEEIINHLQNI